MGKVINLPTIKRFPRYLNVLRHKKEKYTSTSVLISELQLEPVTVRKDLAMLGLPGKPRVGYVRENLIEAIETYLGWHNNGEVFLVGAGALGSALLKYSGFKENGLTILAGFDINENVIGTKIGKKHIFNISKLPDLVKRMNISIAILCVSCENAQEVAEFLVKSGMTGIWNFTNVKLKLPDNVIVQNEDFASGWAIFSVKLKESFR